MEFPSWPAEPDEHPAPPVEPQDKQKKPRHRHTTAQLAALNELYDKNEHPSLDERTSLAERLDMETKTVNAWFQNKRASSKKRHRGGAVAPNYDLPPISALLASTSSSHTPSGAQDFDDYPNNELPPTLPPPRNEKSSAQPMGRIPRSSKTSKQEQPQQQQTAFYAGNPEHRHTYESSGAELPSRPRMRMRPTTYQTEELRKYYLTNPHPTKEEREELGKRISMRYQSITNWFQNQRSLAKKRLEEEEETAKLSQHEQPQASRAESMRVSEPPPQRHSSMSIASLIHRDKSPSVEPSVDSASSRASPYRITVPAHRPRRTRPESHQLTALQKLYNRTSNPSIEERGALAIEVGMDLAKVTNWFRNLRQTARKRAKKPGEDGDTDSVPRDSASVSRAATPSAESSSTGFREHDRNNDIEVEPARRREIVIPEEGQDIDVGLPPARGIERRPERRPDHNYDMETEVEEPSILSQSYRMDVDSTEIAASVSPHRRAAPSEPGTDDEEFHELYTPSPSPSPSPPPPNFIPASFSPVPRQSDASSNFNNVDIHPVDYTRLEKTPGRVNGVKVEDALLLLGFHQHIMH